MIADFALGVTLYVVPFVCGTILGYWVRGHRPLPATSDTPEMDEEEEETPEPSVTLPRNREWRRAHFTPRAPKES